MHDLRPSDRVTPQASPSHPPVLATPITSTTFSIESAHRDFGNAALEELHAVGDRLVLARVAPALVHRLTEVSAVAQDLVQRALPNARPSRQRPTVSSRTWFGTRGRSAPGSAGAPEDQAHQLGLGRVHHQLPVPEVVAGRRDAAAGTPERRPSRRVRSPSLLRATSNGDPMQDDGKFAGGRHLDLLHPMAGGDPQRPSVECLEAHRV